MNKFEHIISANEEALERQSRSFAVPILRMEQRYKLPIMVQYNLCKTIDTIEDSVQLSNGEKVDLINEVCIELKKNRASEHVIQEMLKVTPEDESFVFTNYHSIVALFNSLSEVEQQIGMKYLDEMAFGMADFVEKDIQTLNDLNQYCYYVAGTVGIYLTELLQILSNGIDNAQLEKMKQNGIHFGLFLQKLNIIRDFRSDYTIRERHFWPNEYFNNVKDNGVVLEKMCEETINNDIEAALRYCQAIPPGSDSFDFFIRYILKSGIKYMDILRGNFRIFLAEKVKLSRKFVSGLYDDVADQSRQQFLDEMNDELAKLKNNYRSAKV